MRVNKIKKIVYASGSGVYGDAGETVVDENYSPMRPISPYGASKLAGEALISAYCHLFDMRGVVYRFANVIGGNSTHGVIRDFVKQLKTNPSKLEIMGDGNQTKGYMLVEDIIQGMICTQWTSRESFDAFNLAPVNQITVLKIAQMVALRMGLPDAILICSHSPKYTGGWAGDVPVVRMDSQKARRLGWSPSNETHGAVSIAIEETIERIK